MQNIKIVETINNFGQEGYTFDGPEINSYPFIPLNQLGRYEDQVEIAPGIIETNVSTWVLRVAKSKWSDKILLEQLTRIIMKYFPNSDIDWANTFWLVQMIKNIDVLAEDFIKDVPIENFPGTKYKNPGEWKKKFFEYLQTNPPTFYQQ